MMYARQPIGIEKLQTQFDPMQKFVKQNWMLESFIHSTTTTWRRRQKKTSEESIYERHTEIVYVSINIGPIDFKCQLFANEHTN